MTEPRQLAVVREYLELIDALRARAMDLNVSRQEIDALSGLQPGYTSKLLGPVPIKKLGLGSLGPMLQALGLALAVVEDGDTSARYTARMPNRKHRMPAFGEHDLITYRKTRRALRKAARLGAKMRNEKLSGKKRSKLAKRAARVRWARKRKAERRARLAARAAKALQVAHPAPCASQSPLPNG